MEGYSTTDSTADKLLCAEADIDNALSSVSEKSDAVNYNFYSSWKEAVADEGDFQGFERLYHDRVK